MRKHSSISAEVAVEVAFADVDLAQVVWHGHYLRYLENARWALMNALEFRLQDMIDSGFLWPIVDLQVKYVRAARFGDRLVARAWLVEWQQRLAINYLVTDTADGGRVARARTVQVAVQPPRNELLFEMPRCLTDRVSHYLRAHGLPEFEAHGAGAEVPA
jgi:acyl-CoA thioester hydrolase